MKQLIIVFCAVLIFIISGTKSNAQIDTGTYLGMMHLEPKTLGMDSIPVQLSIEELNDSTWVWKMTYNGLNEKNYRLLFRNGSYLLDELNGILLPGNFDKKLLTFFYEVDQTLYSVVYDFSNKGEILFDLRYFTKSPPVQMKENTVSGYLMKGRQYSLLTKTQ